MEKREHIGQIIKKLRKNKKMSQRDLGAATGLSNTAISYIEKGIYDVKVSNLDKIAKALDTTVEDIMKQVEAEETSNKEDQKPEEKDEQKEPSIEEIEDFLAGQKMLMFKGKPLTEDDLRSVYAFLQFLEKKYGDNNKK
ncbi:helix-turn-helix transcriptional regulator [Thermoanaerobacterium thermosaccharolyticum]|uniref:helix-turn-helix domain-containing protein n=1 Tax=Thermoanaerobacterium thermosaccharolyticum TaxID=1517 RepID=UPI003D2D7FED